MILQTIKEKLLEIDPIVFYGMVDNTVKDSEWNYTVFDRSTVRPTANRTGYSYRYGVHVIREEFVPEGIEIDVIDKMLEIPGMKLADADITYIYTEKPNTNTLIEMVSIQFVRAVKV